MNELGGPIVDPVGRLRYPDGWSGTPRVYSPRTRMLAGALLMAFLGVVVVTTGVSLGGYCLTSHGGDYRALSGWLADTSERAATTKVRP